MQFYKHSGYKVIERIMTHMICDNNTIFHYEITDNIDNEKNFLYGGLIKSISYSFRKSKSKTHVLLACATFTNYYFS